VAKFDQQDSRADRKFWRSFGPSVRRQDNASNEVLLHDQQTICFFVPMIRPIAVGDTVKLVAGGDETTETCNAKFDNILNFRG